jgi:hypothetical protein
LTVEVIHLAAHLVEGAARADAAMAALLASLQAGEDVLQSPQAAFALLNALSLINPWPWYCASAR